MTPTGTTSSLVNQALSDLSAYKSAASTVADDQAKLGTDETTADGLATTASGSVSAAIQALTGELAALPPQSTPPPLPPPPAAPPTPPTS
jgi:hypothetical protein